MDVQMIMQVVGTLGFPIAAYFYQVFCSNQILKQNTEAINTMTTALHTLISTRDVVNHE